MNQIHQFIYNFHLKRKSQIYSVLAVVIPLVMLAKHSSSIDLIHGLVFLALVTLFSIYFPKFILLINKIEDYINLKFALLTPSRLIRTIFHLPMIVGIYLLFINCGVHLSIGIKDILIMVGGSCGLHAIAETLAYKNIGNRSGNTLIAFAVAATLNTLALINQQMLTVCILLVAIYTAYIFVGLLSDFRSKIYPKHGVGVFFGTFNPVHKTHLKILQSAINDRNLEKIFVHSTTIPKLHRDALEKGEISLSYEKGMRVYRKTTIADDGKNYFPTGNKFYEYELRRELLKAGIKDVDLEDKVEILDLPEIYEDDGFSGVLKYIKSNFASDKPIHGIHGSDTGGIWVRNIFDSFGWVYPYPVKRSDNISATSIRNGAIGLTSPTVELFLQSSRNGENFKFASGYMYKFTEVKTK